MAPCSIHSFDDLVSCLEKAVEGQSPSQSITLGAQLFDEAGALAALFGAPALTINQRDAATKLFSYDATSATVAGTAKPLFAAAKYQYAYAVEVKCTYDGAPVLALTATPIPGQSWTFAGNFAADFPDYEGFDSPYVTTLPSFIPGVAFSAPSFAATTKSSALTYAASVDLSTGSLAALAQYLGKGPVQMTGSLAVRAQPGFPKLDLSGPVIYQVPKLSAVSLRIATEDAGPGGVPAASIIELTASVAPGDYRALDVSAPLLQAPYAWELTGEPANPDAYSLAAGIEELGREVGTPLSLPTGVDGLSSLYLQAVLVGFKPAPTITALDLIGVRFGTLKGAPPVWSAPILGLRVDQLAVGWDVVGPMSDSPELLGQLSGKLAVGPAELDVQVSLSGLTAATTPDVAFVVSLDPATTLTVDALFEHFAGVDPGIGVDITELMLEGQTGTRSLQFVAALEPHWPDLPGGVNLLELTLLFNYAPNAITAQAAATVKLLDLEWMLTAAYRGSQLGWRFSGALVPNAQTNNLQTIVNALAGGWFPDPLPANLGKIELRGLSASFETKGNDYSFDGTLGWPFSFPALDIDLDIEAGLKLEKAGDKPPSGTARGQLKVNELALGVVYSFGVKGNETLAFTVGYRGAELTCVISTNDKDEKILRAHLGGVSFGDIVGFLVGLAEDQSGFRLPAPWDVLYQLTFDRLTLEVNLTTRAIGVSYKLDVDLGIVKLDAIGLTYSKYAGSSSLAIDIGGTFFGTHYGDKDPPLSWDMLNEPPPAAPGKGEALLDLRFLAVGQSVAMRRTTRFTGVADAIDALEKDFAPVKGESNPLPALPALKFSGDGRWLIGADFTVMSAVSITGVFVDPSLYGLRIGLAGERMKKLAGLQFEILYQKVTDTIGLYHIELTLPTAMRNLQFGAVAVTLPIVTVDIYTNGNFYLDFGFPKGTDYSRSFTVQAGYFIGRGGFYFGVLDGATSDRVPVPTNGSFSPVIVFGIGLSVGVGRTLEAGPISGGVTITVEGTVEGVLGWFNPTDRSQPTDLYYHVKGTIAIVGKAWGVVDFVVVKASLSVTAYASVTLTVEAYKAIQVQLSVGVEVSASLTILFFTVSFSFSTSLDLSFTIGSDSTPPWRIATSAPADRPLQLRQQGTRHSPRATPPLHLQRRVRERTGRLPEFDWTAQRVVGDTPVDVDLTLVPAFTPAGGSDGGAPAVQIVMSLFIDTSTPSGALHAHEVASVEHDDPGQVAFNLLAAGVLRWAIASLRTPLANSGEVTIGDLDAIAKFLADRRNRDATFTYENVTSLIEHNFVLRVSNPIGPNGVFYDPGSDSPRGATPSVPHKALFPMIPEIEMQPDGRPPVTFIEHAIADQTYRDRLETYYDQLLTAGPDRSNGSNAMALGPGAQAVSVTLFCDYFGLLAQQAVHQAVRTLDAYPYEATGAERLVDIATSFGGWQVEHQVRPGDTVATIAAEHGTTIAELQRANDALDDAPPEGSAVTVEAGPTVARIAVANADYPLATGAVLTVKGVRHQVRGTQTLGQVAAAFGLADTGALLTGKPACENARSTALLQPGAQLSVPQLTYTVVADDLLVASEARERIAANFYARARQATQVTAGEVDWYVAAIGGNSPQFSGRIDIPVATLDKDGNLVDSGQTTPYIVRPSDTLPGVAAAFAQLQLRPNDPGFQAYLAKVTAGPFAPGTKVTLPAVALALESGDTFESLAATFYLDPQAPADAGLEALAQANASTQLLAQHAVLALPTVRISAAKDDTLAIVAERLDLSVEALADSAAEDAGILAPYAQTQRRVTVPHVASRDLDTLIGDLTRFGSLNTLSTTVSRFLLSGMQAPFPVPPDEPLEEDALHGLYDVAGQQFPAPTGATFDIGFTKSTTASWFCFDPAVGEREQAGPEGCADELLMTLTPGFLSKHAPSTVLDPQTVAGPTAMPLYDLDPPRYSLEQHIPWQPAADVPLPGPTGPSGPSAGGPSLWLFPAALQQAAGGPTGPTAATRPYELIARSPAPAGATSAPVKQLQRFSWATAIPLRIERALDDTGAVVPGAYEVTGADQASRDLLLKAWSYLEHSSSPRDRLYLLRRPPGAGDNSAGLLSDVIDPAGTFLLRTNLSTETHSNQAFTAMAVQADDGDYYARIGSIGAFLREVWEASITGTGGFHLSYASTGGGLPEELFATDGSTTLWAVLLLDRQSHGLTPERGLFPFNNCAVVAENLDASATTIFAELSDPLPEDLRAVASVPAGVVGFALARRNPGGVTGMGPTGLTRQLHSLVGYRVKDGQDFAESHQGLPVSPLDEPPEWLIPAGGTGHEYWSYVQGIPVSRLGRVTDAPSSPALPPASASPYRGVTGPGPGVTRRLSSATVDLAFHDVYGNTTNSTQPLPSIDLPVGYTDDVIGISAWPGCGMDYLFRAANGGSVLLDATLALHAERYVPSPGNPVEHARNAARGDAERYAAVFYQLAQHDVDVALSSNIGAPRPMPGDLKAACSAFVTKAKLFADTTSLLRAQTYTTAGGALGALCDELGISAGTLLGANPDADAAALFPGLYVKPKIVAAPPMNTLTSLAATVAGRSGVPVADRTCAGVTGPDPSCDPVAEPAGATPLAVAGDNAAQPLTPGVVLRTKTRTSPPLAFSDALPDRLSAVAAALGTPVYAEVVDPADPKGPKLRVGLVPDNWTAAGLIADRIKLTIGGVHHTTKNDDTFESLLTFFKAELSELTEGGLARALRDVEGLLAAGKTVDYAALVVPPPAPNTAGTGPPEPTYSLADVPAAAGTVDDLAPLNACVANFFNTGAPILLGWSCCKAAAHSTPATLVHDAGISLDQLAAYNLPTALGSGVALTIPDLVALGETADCWTAYGPKPSDTLATVATALGTTAGVLADVNRQLLGVLEPEARVTVDGRQLSVLADDTLESLCKRFGGGLTWDRFVQELAQPANAGALRPSGAVAAPLPPVPATAPAIEDLAASLNVDPVALVEANGSLRGFLREGAVIAGPGGATVTAGAYETVQSVLWRLRPEHPDVKAADLVELNRGRTGLVTPGRRVLVPPRPTVTTMPFTPQVPPEGATGEDRIVFPVQVTATVSRARGLVHPDFARNESVSLSASALAPRIGAPGATTLTLDDFAARFEEAFAGRRLKCAVAGGASTTPGPGRIWAANMGPEGVARLAVDPSRPAFYALRPLATQPLDRRLTFQTYVSGQGLGPTATQHFTGVDLDAWMRQLLDTVDLALTPSFSVPAFRIGATAGPLEAAADAAAPGDGPRGIASELPGAGVARAATVRPPDGPAAYERLVGAKEALAGGLRDRVGPIVQAPGATGAYNVSAAREALYQQMLVRLSDGYDVSAVVQFPVDVVSPMVTPRGPTGTPHPPRVSGKVVPVRHTVATEPRAGAAGAPPDSLAGAADGFGVPAPFLAEVIADMTGLLRPGVPVHGHPVDTHDTLARIALLAQPPVDPSDWETWSAWVAPFATQSVFVEAATFPVSQAARVTAPGESLGDLAEFFGRDPGSVARANATTPGVVAAGSLQLAGYPAAYDVQSTDTLQDVAAGISSANPGKPALTLDSLALALAPLAGRLTPGVELRIVETLPDMSLSTAKVSLGPVGATSGPPPPLTFLVTVKHAEEQRNLLLNLDFAINELEYGIRNVANAGSYQASSWLTLVRPFEPGRAGADAAVSTAVPQVQVPIPLRAYPQPPLLTGQSGLASAPGATAFPAVRQWDYRYDFAVRSAAQDTGHLKVVFTDPHQLFGAAELGPSLYAGLAAFITAYPALSADLARLPGLPLGSQDPVAGHALEALSQLAQGVADGLGGAGLGASLARGATAAYGYGMTTLDDGSNLESLTLVPELGPTGASAVWPAMYLRRPEGATGGTGPDSGFDEMPGTNGVYRFPRPVARDSDVAYRARFSGRDVIFDKTGRGSIGVSRNDRLIAHGPLGPTGSPAPVPTYNDFVYRTPPVEFVDALVPLVDNGARIDVAALGASGRQPLAQRLLDLLRAATSVVPGGSTGSQLIELLCAYGFDVAAAGDDSIAVTSPIRLLPATLVGPADVQAFATRLAANLTGWYRTSKVDPALGYLVMELSVFTSAQSRLGARAGGSARRSEAVSGGPIGATAAPPAKPVLRLTNLQLEMASIDWSV